MARMILEVLLRLREDVGINEVVLSGGVFLNALLTSRVVPLLEERGFVVFTHHKVPPNDGGISLGQALYGANR